jgi:glycosyltransferase involved in cell wall biosynthesis/predicted SAM-dependent methyltransferase
MKAPQKFTVVIPTLNRVETLESALKTCVIQDHPHFEIIVSDNASVDNTAALVNSITDPRIRYINPGYRLGLSEHWEFALSHVSEGYVTILGDDGGLLPGAIKAISGLIESSGTKAFTWRKVDYCWPQHIVEDYRNYLAMSLDDSVISSDCSVQVRRAVDFQIPYYDLPCINNSFIAIDTINEFKKLNSEMMFTATAPDIFSGFAVASILDQYTFSNRPYSISGGLTKSNGTETVQKELEDPIENDFSTQQKYKFEDGLPLCGIVEFLVLDSFLKVAKVSNSFSVSWVDYSRVIESAIRNAAAGLQSNSQYIVAVQAIGAFASGRGLRQRFEEMMALFKRPPNPGRRDAPGLYSGSRRLVLNAFNLRVENVFDVAHQVDGILKLKTEKPALFEKLCESKNPEIGISLFACAGSAPVRLHLGCGSAHFDGYVNVDFPPSEHNVMDVKADVFCDVTKIDIPEGEVDEIRLHHVFEHFNRVVAIALLIKWHGWLRIGGKLHIETPDFQASAADFLGGSDLGQKMRAIRHLEGDQTAGWAYHVGQWFPERFAHTFATLGFADIKIAQEASGHSPPLFNVRAIGAKERAVPLATQYQQACGLLRQFMVADAEDPTWQVWTRQLAGALDLKELPHPTIFHPPEAVLPLAVAPQVTELARVDNAVLTAPKIQSRPITMRRIYFAILNRVAKLDQKVLGGRLRRLKRRMTGQPKAVAEPTASAELALLAYLKSSVSLGLDQAHNFNAWSRDKWVAQQAATVPAGARVLDVGAGTAPYRALFSHCVYETHDFAQYKNYQDGSEGSYAPLNYVSDVCKIPVPDKSFDVILCTEVLEHVPYPIDALAEMCRIVKLGGTLFITAPLGSGLHQQPYHFYGGYTDNWYRKFLTEFGCEAISIEPNHGFFAHLAQECARFSWTYDQHKQLHGAYGPELSDLMGNVLARYFYELDAKAFIREFTIGFHVVARRVSNGPVRVSHPYADGRA